MSKTRTNSPITDIDDLARREGIRSLVSTGDASRTFTAFGREFEISEASPGKVGIFNVKSKPVNEATDDAAYEGTLTHAKVSHLFRRAVKWKEQVA